MRRGDARLLVPLPPAPLLADPEDTGGMAPAPSSASSPFFPPPARRLDDVMEGTGAGMVEPHTPPDAAAVADAKAEVDTSPSPFPMVDPPP